MVLCRFEREPIMPEVTRSILVNYTAEEVFTVVNDIQSYSLFVPSCTKGAVHEQTQDEMLASISFKALGFTKTLTTRNKIQFAERIEMSFVDGPFSQLTGVWDFIPLSDSASKAVCTLNFTPQSRYAKMAAKSALNKAANAAVDSFHKRIIQLYGKR